LIRQANKIFWLSLMGLLFCLFLSLTQAQASDINSSDKNLLGVKSNTKSLSLLDPQRLRMYHSYTFSYFSGAKTSGSFGVYTTILNYQLSNPLSLTLSLNYLHQPLSVFGRDDLRVKNDILPNFQLHYRPNNKFSLWINVVTFLAPFCLEDENYLWWERERSGFDFPQDQKTR
jgi:hypothetical protein